VLSGLNLNLLTALDALLTERNVTRAGASLGLSQPAMSAALARLRRQFDDELLVRTGAQYELTPLARELIEPLKSVMTSIDEMLALRPSFEPTTSRREFSIALSDYGQFVLTRPLLAAVGAEAPGVRLRFETVGPNNDVDIAISPAFYVTEERKFLWSDPWVAVVDKNHPDVGGQLTAELVAELPYVRSSLGGQSPVDMALDQLGVEYHVGATVASFMGALMVVLGTPMFTLVPSRIARGLASTVDIRILEPPMEIPVIEEFAFWRTKLNGDRGHQWLREIMFKVAAGL
jgi:DNA-binding transcriptional LysR family regulator